MLIFPSLSGQYETITGQESAGFITTFSNLQQFILLSSQSNHHVFLHSHLADFLPCVIALVGLGLLEFTANGLREKTRPPFLGSQSGLHLAFRPSQLDFLEYLQNHVGQISPLFEGGPTSVGRSPRLTDGIDRGALKRSVAETHEDYRFQTLESENPFWNDILRRLNLSNLYTTQWEVIQKTATGQKVIVSMEPGSGKMLSVFLAAIYQVVQRFQSVLILVPNDSIADEIKIEYYSKIQDLHWMQGLSLQILTSDEERRDTGHVTALAMQELPSERQPDIILATPDRLHALLKTRHRARDFIRNLGFVGIVEASLHGFIQSFHTAMVLRRFFTMTRLVFRGRYGARWMGEDGFPELGVLVTMEACANPDAFASFLTGLDFLPSNVITASQSPVRDKNLYAIRPYQKNEDELNGPLSIFKAALRFQSLPFLLLGYGENLILADKLRIARMAEQQTGELRSRIMNSLFLESELVRGRSEAGLPNRNRLLEARTAVLNLGDDPASSAALLSAMGLFAAGEPPLVLIPIRNDQDLQRAQKVTRSAGMPNNAGSSPRQMIVPDFDERTLPVLQSHLHCLFEEMDRSFLRGYTRSDLMAFFGGGLNHRMAELIQRSLDAMQQSGKIRIVDNSEESAFEAVSTLEDIYDFPFDAISPRSAVRVSVLNTTKEKYIESFDLDFKYPPGSVVYFDGKRRRLLESSDASSSTGSKSSAPAAMLGADHESFYSRTQIRFQTDFWQEFVANPTRYKVESRFVASRGEELEISIVWPCLEPMTDHAALAEPSPHFQETLRISFELGSLEYRDAITDRLISRANVTHQSTGMLELHSDEIVHVFLPNLPAPEVREMQSPGISPMEKEGGHANSEDAIAYSSQGNVWDEFERERKALDAAQNGDFSEEAEARPVAEAASVATEDSLANENEPPATHKKTSTWSSAETLPILEAELRRAICALVCNPEDLLEIKAEIVSGPDSREGDGQSTSEPLSAATKATADQSGAETTPGSSEATRPPPSVASTNSMPYGQGLYLSFIHKPIFSSNLLPIVLADLCGENTRGASLILRSLAENRTLLDRIPLLSRFRDNPTNPAPSNHSNSQAGANES